MATYYATYDNEKIVIPSDYGDMVVPVFHIHVAFAKGNTYVLIPANGVVPDLSNVSSILGYEGERIVVPTPTGTVNVMTYHLGAMFGDTDYHPIITAEDYNRGVIKSYLSDDTVENRISARFNYAIGQYTTNYYQSITYGRGSSGSGGVSDRYASPHLFNGIWFLAMILDSDDNACLAVVSFRQDHNSYDPDITITNRYLPSSGRCGAITSITGITNTDHSITIGTSSSEHLPSSKDLVYEYLMVKDYVPSDPYGEFPSAGEDPGNPDPDQEDDDIEEESLPTLSFASAGFARIYRPSLQQINDLADYMWTDQTFLQTVIDHLKQLLENPMDAVISLSLVPCVPPVGTDVSVKVMYVDTGVEMPPVANQFVTVDCGTVNLKEMYGSALDYNPYTKVQLYLPYVGTVELDTDEVMGMSLQVKYNIDVVTGLCCAYVRVYGTRRSDGKYHDDVMYQFSGHCSINQPISSADFSSYLNAAIAAAKVAVAASTGVAGAAAGAAASGVSAPTPAVGGTNTPMLPPSTALVPATSSGPQHFTLQQPGGSNIQASNVNFAELAKPGNINTVASAMGGKLAVMHSGGFGGNSGYLAAIRRPYLIITRPQIANPEQYGQFNGRPAMLYLNLGSCVGYTQVQSVHLTGFDATNPELAEISELLKGGVVL